MASANAQKGPAPWYKKPTEDQLRLMRHQSLQKPEAPKLVIGLGGCRAAILAIELQINGKRLSP